MSRVNGVNGSAIAANGGAKAALPTGGGFAVDPQKPMAEAAVQAQGMQPVGLAGMLALQEAEAGIFENSNGRRHGSAILDGLQELQHGLLGAPEASPAQIASLVRLAEKTPDVADPGLQPILNAIRLRARIELLRRGVETP